jgi:pyrophosphatase PpaX
MKYRYVLFDLDGTLLDTNELIIRSFEYTLEKFYPGRYTRTDILPLMGQPLIQQMEFYAGEDAARLENHVQQMVDTYREYNIAMHDQYVALFPHVSEVLATLHAEGVRLAVVTSKMRKTAQMGLDLFLLTPFFEAIVAVEDTEKHKPDPEPLLLAMDKLGAERERTIMVGDSPYDLLGAKAAEVASCGVAWSLRGREALAELKPDYIIDDMRELLSIVRG